jgi:tRNA threonylcarbamoyladenosine biosynthesis protein TsaB
MVTNGPGSFTGVRVGLAAALGIKTASNKIVKSISNLQVLAWKARELFSNKKQIIVILDARREQLYFQRFDINLKPLNEPSLIMVEEVFKYLSQEVVFIGDGIKFLPEEYFNENLNIVTNAEILSCASEFYWNNGGYNDLIPLYIRQPDALEIKK